MSCYSSAKSTDPVIHCYIQYQNSNMDDRRDKGNNQFSDWYFRLDKWYRYNFSTLFATYVKDVTNVLVGSFNNRDRGSV
jgi:hypothetical protein